MTLFEKALAEGACLDATDAQGSWTFERLPVDRHGARTRATLKIQEGCDRYCAYCVIPYVRGPVRSMPLEDVAAQARALAEAGYREVVITGIHLASYGRESGETLLDAISAAAAPAGIRRVRLGSLEPVVVTEPFVEGLEKIGKICPQFHLSLQSGSESVLRRMRRRYTPGQYLAAARLLQAAWRPAALTTDVLTGFPGETPEEAAQTEAFVEEVGFARLHVFPYSRRAGTLADRMPGQVSESVRQERCRRLIDIGNRLEARFVQELIGSVREVLFETPGPAGTAEGYTPEYVRVRAVGRPGEIRPALLTGIDQGIALGQSGEEL